MGVQKSQKGRASAAFQTDEVVRRVNRKRNNHPGRQQFGGVGSAPGLDDDVNHLSGRANRGILNMITRKRKAS
jgi:hypothetical protein